MASAHTVTILITDVVGSTEQRAAIGDERADIFRREHDRLLAGVVSAAGGTVVKGLGDGVMASFGGAADALAAAVGMQQVVDRQGRTGGEPARIRIGLSAGDVSIEDGDCFGTPVIQAARLCAAAEAGQILAADIVPMLAGSRGGFEFTALGPLELKGLPAPVTCVAVSWAPDEVDPADPADRPEPSAVTLPLPAALTGLLEAPLAGRTEAWQALKAAWAAAATGQRQVVLVAGEPGVGKTRLAAELAGSAAEEGSVVLFGSSDEDVELPFGPFAQALRPLVRHAPDDLIAAHVHGCGGALLALAPGLGERTTAEPLPSTAASEADRQPLFDAATDLLPRTAERSAVVLVLDDLHWADTSTLRLLRHLVRTAADCPLLVIGTYRDTDVDRTHPLSAMVGDLRRDPHVTRLALAGLDTAGVAEYLVGRAGHDLPAVEQLAGLLRDQTEGNPFFLGEVVQHLVEAGAFFRAGDRWQADEEVFARIGVPEGIRDVIGRRLSALPDQLSEVLRVAAIVGAQFDASVVASVAGLPIDAVLDLLDLAVR